MKPDAEFTPGDVVEVFNPKTSSFEWIEVEDVLTSQAGSHSQILVARGVYYCACWVRVESIPTPHTCALLRRVA
jgi:hypothetical protein